MKQLFPCQVGTVRAFLFQPLGTRAPREVTRAVRWSPRWAMSDLETHGRVKSLWERRMTWVVFVESRDPGPAATGKGLDW